ncbi:MAG: tRNA uridine-5-carboxymethylaminomethyl(34) synthesis enzyme MnmG, partial [Lentisphaerae bacterium]
MDTMNILKQNHDPCDVIVIGAGHAGCEAALAAARMGARVRLFTFNLDHIAQMSCNPAVGGIAKGHVVCEIDALGGEMGRNTDASRIQFRMLNRRKGPAVWSPRAQTDKLVYQKRMKHVLERTRNLTIHQAEVVQLIHDDEKVHGVKTIFDETWYAGAVVICSGTFLRGKLHYGMQQYPGGRAGDPPSNHLARYLNEEMGLTMERLKTGTPPRILASSIDFASLEEQESDPEGTFTFWPEAIHGWRSIAPEDIPQRPCYITHSTTKTKEIILNNLHLAPMYNGTIEGKPTRYCPSFEDKVTRFADHETHQIYVEPEGAFTEEYYLNGISTSLPVHVQHEMIRSLPG